MNNTNSTLVVLIDADDFKHVFSTWPDHICLATCLTNEGNCSMVLFRRDEYPVIHRRLMQMLNLVSSDVCFVPKVQGYPTKHFLYSDERRLMALVSSDPDILDEAIDYAVNYTYALEEGLDPEVVLGLKPTVESPPVARTPVRHRKLVQQPAAPEPVAPRGPSPLLPEFLRRSAEQTRRPRFATVRSSKVGMLATQA